MIEDSARWAKHIFLHSIIIIRRKIWHFHFTFFMKQSRKPSISNKDAPFSKQQNTSFLLFYFAINHFLLFFKLMEALLGGKMDEELFSPRASIACNIHSTWIHPILSNKKDNLFPAVREKPFSFRQLPLFSQYISQRIIEK